MCCRGTHAAAPHDDKQKDVEASEADLFHGVLHRERLLCRNTGEGFIFLFLTAVTSQHKLQEPLPNPSHLPPDAPPPTKAFQTFSGGGGGASTLTIVAALLQVCSFLLQLDGAHQLSPRGLPHPQPDRTYKNISDISTTETETTNPEKFSAESKLVRTKD